MFQQLKNSENSLRFTLEKQVTSTPKLLCCLQKYDVVSMGNMRAVGVLELLFVSAKIDNHRAAGPGDKDRKQMF